MKKLLAVLAILFSSSAFAQTGSANYPEGSLYPNYAADTGGTNTLVVAPVGCSSTLIVGAVYKALPGHANTTTTPTLAWCGASAKTITKFGTAALAANDLLTTADAMLIYDGTEFQLQNPQTLSSVGGAVSGVSNSDGTLTISPTTGAVVASIALGHPNTWSATQTFPNTSITNAELVNSATTVNSQTCTLGSSCTIPLSAINPQTTTYQVLAADFLNYKTVTVASGTFTITLVASGSQPANGQYINVINYGSGVVTIARSGQNINGGTGSLTLGAASATVPTSATIWSDGTNYFAATDTGANVISVSNSDGTLTISPTTGAPVASIALGHANTWTSTQTFPSPVITGTIPTYNGLTTAGLGVVVPLGVSNVTAQSASQTTVNLLASTPSAGFYLIRFYFDQNALCTTGTGSVYATVNWTDASHARSAQTVPLTLANTTNSATQGFINAAVPLWSASASAITYTTTYSGCATGTGTYDLHAEVEQSN